tara:strand:- start:5776 stop:6666 length:891 start_codon:yes stop_codon:yes gene_type:complete
MKFKELINEAAAASDIMTSFPKSPEGGYGKMDSNLKVGDLVMYNSAYTGGVMSQTDTEHKGAGHKSKLVYRNAGITKDKWLKAIGKVTKLSVGSTGDLIAAVSGGNSLTYGISGVGGYANMLVRVDKQGKALKPKWVDTKEFTKTFLSDKDKEDIKLMAIFGIKVPYPEAEKIPKYPNFKKGSFNKVRSQHEKYFRLGNEYKLKQELGLKHPNSFLFRTATEYGDKSPTLSKYLAITANNTYNDDIARGTKSSNKLLNYFYKNALIDGDKLYLDLTNDKHLKTVEKLQSMGMLKKN